MPEVKEVLKENGMEEVVLDGAMFKTKEEFFAFLISDCNFPDYFGGNLDALHDVLEERRANYCYKMIHTEEFIQNLGTYGKKIISIMQIEG